MSDSSDRTSSVDKESKGGLEMDVMVVRARKGVSFEPCTSELGESCRIIDRESASGNAHECARWNVTSALQSEKSDNISSLDKDPGASMMSFACLGSAKLAYIISNRLFLCFRMVSYEERGVHDRP
jgi:hypothetical protein